MSVQMSGGNEKAGWQNRYAAPNVDVGLYAPQGVDLGVTQQDGLSHSANCKAQLIKRIASLVCYISLQLLYIFIPNMKFLCVTLRLGEMCTDDDTNNDNAHNDDARQTKHYCIRLFG